MQKGQKIHYLIRKFLNHLMVNGKKEKVEKIFLNSLDYIKFREEKNGISILFKALENCKPITEIRSIRRGGATYQIPVPLSEKRSISLAIKYLVESANKKKGSFSINLAQTLIEASKNLGESVKKRESIHGMALKNRSFTHYRWF
jgi:small subunit ribosomal protein S7